MALVIVWDLRSNHSQDTLSEDACTSSTNIMQVFLDKTVSWLLEWPLEKRQTTLDIFSKLDSLFNVMRVC
jgi:hypothetical protein